MDASKITRALHSRLADLARMRAQSAATTTKINEAIAKADVSTASDCRKLHSRALADAAAASQYTGAVTDLGRLRK